MGNQSKLLETAENVCKLFRDVVLNADDDQMLAAASLVKMAVAVNQLSIEVKNGRELLEQFSKLKEELMPTDSDNAPVSEEKPAAPAPNVPVALDPNKIVEDIMKSLNIPAEVLAQAKKSGQ